MKLLELLSEIADGNEANLRSWIIYSESVRHQLNGKVQLLNLYDNCYLAESEKNHLQYWSNTNLEPKIYIHILTEEDMWINPDPVYISPKDFIWENSSDIMADIIEYETLLNQEEWKLRQRYGDYEGVRAMKEQWKEQRDFHKYRLKCFERLLRDMQWYTIILGKDLEVIEYSYALLEQDKTNLYFDQWE